MLAGLLAALVAWSAPASAAVSHVVVSGESLSSVAAANGISIDSLASYNGLGDDSQLIIGQTIQVPASTEVGTTTSTTTTSSSSGHVVVSGESLSSIAAANGISIDSLASYNGLDPDALLIIGQTIQVPAASSATGTTTTSTLLGREPRRRLGREPLVGRGGQRDQQYVELLLPPVPRTYCWIPTTSRLYL